MFVSAVRPKPSFAECATGANDRGANGNGASVDALLSRVASLTDDALVTESRRIASAISAAQAELAAVLAEVESRQLHSSWDCSTVERFAGWHCQVTPSRAASLTTLGRALRALPVLASSVVDGSLAADKAVAVARVAAPDTEAALVELAVNSTVDQTRRICGAWRRVDDTASASAQADVAVEEQAIGRVLVIHDDDGVELRARFDHVHGALVLAALDTSTAQVRTEREHAAAVDPPGPRTSTVGAVPASVDEIPRERLDRGQWRAQGLLRMCEFASAASPTELQPSGFTAQLVVHIPVDTLLDPVELSDLGSGSSESGGLESGGSQSGRSESGGRESSAAGVLEPRGARVRRDAAHAAPPSPPSSAAPSTPDTEPALGPAAPPPWSSSTTGTTDPSVATTTSRTSSPSVATTTPRSTDDESPLPAITTTSPTIGARTAPRSSRTHQCSTLHRLRPATRQTTSRIASDRSASTSPIAVDHPNG
jgi:hypothetical protein